MVTFKLGDKVRVKKCAYFPKLVGMRGTIYKTFEFNENTFYGIYATNTKEFCYKEGNISSRLAEELEIL